MAHKKTIKYHSENGYTGILYGKSSLAILKDNKEVMHTGFRSINTREELVELVENCPKFFKMLNDNWVKIYNDNDGIDV